MSGLYNAFKPREHSTNLVKNRNIVMINNNLDEMPAGSIEKSTHQPYTQLTKEPNYLALRVMDTQS
jgi:hypothetical protein